MRSYCIEIYNLQTAPQSLNNFTIDGVTDTISEITIINQNGPAGSVVRFNQNSDQSITLFDDDTFTINSNKNEKFVGVFNIQVYASANPIQRVIGQIAIIVKRYTNELQN